MAGDDVLDGRAGTDTLRGGAGNDLIYVDNLRDRVLEGAEGGADTVIATVTYRLSAAAEIEWLATADATALTAINLTGSETTNTITGNAGTNRLYGLGGHDTLYGLGGNDVLWGGDGFDSLAGGEGNDTLFGEDGFATLDGGSGNDVLWADGRLQCLMTGGAGADVFVFDDNPFPTITDYSGPEDTMRVPQALVPGLPTGVLAASAFSATLAGVTDITRIYLDNAFLPDSRWMWYDPDGSGSASPEII
ncbi:MAG: hypothetical protein IT562_09840, partial [Alphaproteobacteria bacterium]|nr:hypothetical protein [Alphaproteobacteria bacterium]